jgi:hypothetical protein
VNPQEESHGKSRQAGFRVYLPICCCVERITERNIRALHVYGSGRISALVQIFSMGRVRSWRRIDLRSEERIPDSERSLVFEA